MICAAPLLRQGPLVLDLSLDDDNKDDADDNNRSIMIAKDHFDFCQVSQKTMITVQRKQIEFSRVTRKGNARLLMQ